MRTHRYLQEGYESRSEVREGSSLSKDLGLEQESGEGRGNEREE